MPDDKKNQNTETRIIQEIEKSIQPSKSYDSEIRHNYEINEQKSHNFSLQFKTKETTPPTVTTSSTEEK